MNVKEEDFLELSPTCTKNNNYIADSGGFLCCSLVARWDTCKLLNVPETQGPDSVAHPTL